MWTMYVLVFGSNNSKNHDFIVAQSVSLPPETIASRKVLAFFPSPTCPHLPNGVFPLRASLQLR